MRLIYQLGPPNRAAPNSNLGSKASIQCQAPRMHGGRHVCTLAARSPESLSASSLPQPSAMSKKAARFLSLDFKGGTFRVTQDTGEMQFLTLSLSHLLTLGLTRRLRPGFGPLDLLAMTVLPFMETSSLDVGSPKLARIEELRVSSRSQAGLHVSSRSC